VNPDHSGNSRSIEGGDQCGHPDGRLVAGPARGADRRARNCVRPTIDSSPRTGRVSGQPSTRHRLPCHDSRPSRGREVVRRPSPRPASARWPPDARGNTRAGRPRHRHGPGWAGPHPRRARPTTGDDQEALVDADHGPLSGTGVGMLWTAGTWPPARSAVRLLGRARAELLEALRSPATTTDLARALGVTPSAVSRGCRPASGIWTCSQTGEALSGSVLPRLRGSAVPT
jgi:hypothetical protein